MSTFCTKDDPDFYLAGVYEGCDHWGGGGGLNW